MNQFDDRISEYMEVTKETYKDLVMVAKDADTSEVKTQSLVFKVTAFKSGISIAPTEHVQNFFYVLVDPVHWHVTLF